MNIFILALRTLRREWRLPELRTLALSLVLAIVALGVVATLATRVERGIRASSAELVGGDTGVSASLPIPASFEEQARSDGLTAAHTARFPSMVFAGDGGQLLNISAVSSDWPLRGAISVRGPDGQPRDVSAPAAGEIYLDPRALASLGIAIGDSVQFGDAELRVTAELLRQPDGGNLFALAPAAIASLADAERSGLLGPGSRIRYSLLLAGDPRQVQTWADWAGKQELPDRARVIRPEDSQESLGNAFERANAFLRLCALLAALLAGVAIALAAQRYAQRKTDEIALLRALGTPRRDVLRLLGGTLAGLALPAAALGVGLTLGISALAWHFASGMFSSAPTLLPLAPAFAAAAMGLAILAGFALPPLTRLADVPPVAVFRRSMARKVRRFDLLYLLPVVVAGLLVWLQAGNGRLALILAASLAVVAVAAILLALLLLWLARRLAAGAHPALRLGLAALARRRTASVIQATALSLGLCALLLLAVTAPAMLQSWREELPTDTPNWFALNILEDQRPAYQAALEQAGASQLAMMPLAVGKLTAINGEPVEKLNLSDPEARERASEQLRLSWSADLPEANTLVAGQWLEAAPSRPEVSIDVSWRDRFGLKLGDTLTFQSGDRTVEAEITSVRQVDWSSFRVNFFLLLDPAHAAELPHTWIASYYLPPGHASALATLARDYPNVSMLDVNDLLERVRDIVDRVSGAVRWVLAFSLLAGALVLAAALAASAGQRQHEAALLRTLGAQRSQLRMAAICEFLSLGLIAAITATIGAAGAGLWLGSAVFRMPHTVLPWGQLALVGLIAALIITLLGVMGTRRILRTSPMALLRSA